MNSMRILFRWISLFFFAGTLLAARKPPTLKQQQAKLEKKATPVESITEWKDLPGGNYVVGYGPHPLHPETIVPLGVYDKTFRNFLSSNFVKNSFLYAFGFENRMLSDLARDLNKTHKAQRGLTEETFEEFLAQLEGTEQTFFLKANFWKNPHWKWKEGEKPDPKGPAPEIIYLGNADLHAMFKEHRAFQQIRKNFPALFANDTTPVEIEEILLELAEAKLTRMPSGEYEFQGSGSFEHSIAPIKIIDFIGKKSSYTWAFQYAVSILLIKSVLSFIPVYGPPQLAIAMIERVFNLAEVVYLIRHGMALSLVMEALDGNNLSPFYGVFTHEQLEDASTYLLLSSTFISKIIINAKGKDRVFHNYWKSIHRSRTRSIHALESRGVDVFPIENSFFALGKKPRESGMHSLKIYSLVKQKVFRSAKPACIVDFEHTKAEHRTRNFLEWGLISLSAIQSSILVPAVGSIVKLIWKEGFCREIHRRQIQESGFRALLLNHPQDFFDALTKAGYTTPSEQQLLYVRALGIIEDRETNPFDLKTIEHEYWRRKVEKWILKRDPTYIPEPFFLPDLLRKLDPASIEKIEDMEEIEIEDMEEIETEEVSSKQRMTTV